MTIQEYEKKYGQNVHSPENQEILRKLVYREVYHNISMLVSHFLQNHEALNGSGFGYDEILDLCESRDYEEAARDEGWQKYSDGFYVEADYQYYLSINLQERGLLHVSVHKQEYPEQGTNGATVWHFNGTEDEAAEVIGIDITDPDELQEHLLEIGILEEGAELHDNELCNWETSEAEDWQKLCEEEGIEPHIDEVFEHYVVSPWFIRKLDEKGENVTDDFFGMNVWGRGCTGQAIMMDGVIAEIAIDMEILTGMRNEWGM